MKFGLIILMFLSSFCFSQENKVDLIFNDGDTLSGYGLIIKNHNIKFRLFKEDKPEEWDDLMIKRIILYGYKARKIFEYIKVNKRQKPILAEVIREGKVTLYNKLVVKIIRENPEGKPIYYGYKKFYTYNSTTTLVKRDKEEIATDLRGNFKKKSLEYFKDCSGITDIFKDKTYLKYKIEDLVVEYNLYCSD